MNILAVADKESKFYWDFYQPGKLDHVDLILSCGDLRAEYLDFLTTFSRCPVLYVHGNHDTRYTRRPPEVSICIDDRIYVHNGVRILGLGGCILLYRENIRVNHLFFAGFLLTLGLVTRFC